MNNQNLLDINDYEEIEENTINLQKKEIKFLSKEERNKLKEEKTQLENLIKENKQNKNKVKKEHFINPEFKKPEKSLLSNKRQKELSEERKEKELIKQQYLNTKEVKEHKIYDKNKVVFNFDWDPV